MKKFFKEFKAFIMRGNVIDMAVGIIIGSAFTAIITAIVGNILTPLINWIPVPGGDGTGALQVVLRQAKLDEDGNVLTEALVINFGAVISAIITFLITAFVLFIVIKAINKARESGKKLKEIAHKELMGDKGAEVAESEAAAEPAPEPEPAPASAEDLLREIRDLLAQGVSRGEIAAKVEDSVQDGNKTAETAE